MRINTKEDIVRFAKKFGKGMSEQLLTTMANQLEFSRALQSYPGTILLDDIEKRWLSLFKSIVEMSATTEQQIEFRVVHNLLCQWANRIEHVAEMDASEGEGSRHER